jgi:hypothetical protein
MTGKMPPVPPENRSPKGTGGSPEAPRDTAIKENADPEQNLGEQGRQGNINQNTTNQGYRKNR